MKSVLVCSDVLALSVSVVTGLLLKYLQQGNLELASYLRLYPFLAVFPMVFAFEGLYSGIPLSPPEELRRTTLSSAAIFLFLAAITVSLRGASTYFTPTMFISLVTSLVLIPLFRVVIRRRLVGRSWWGFPAIVIGSGEAARRAIQIMKQERWLGLKPLYVVDDNIDEQFIEGVPVVSSRNPDWSGPGAHTSVYGVLALAGASPERVRSTIEQYGDSFARLFVLPDLLALSSLWVSPRNFGGVLGLETYRQVLSAPNRIFKRCIDMVLTLVGGIVVLPLIGLIVLWIRLDSKGPAFFGHRRIGKGGREFKAWKFRSMAVNAGEVIEKLLASDPEARVEWETTQKLRHDPRVTRAGSFLRKTSLDELPQLWNVLSGEMSLVGPRPIVHAEVCRYGTSFELYTRVESGVTGLWQVSGRNDTSYEERVKLDSYYVRNWSVWLDLCILFQTVGVVLVRKGAY